MKREFLFNSQLFILWIFSNFHSVTFPDPFYHQLTTIVLNREYCDFPSTPIRLSLYATVEFRNNFCLKIIENIDRFNDVCNLLLSAYTFIRILIIAEGVFNEH